MENKATKNVFKSGADEALLKRLLLERWICYIKYMAEKNER